MPEIGLSDRMVGKRRVLYGLPLAILATLFLLGYAAITLTYKESTLDLGVKTPPVIWKTGADYSTAVDRGYAASFATSTNKTYITTLTIKGMPEVQVVIDDLLNLENQSKVVNLKVEVSTAISGSLVSNGRITTLKLRFWKGATAPTTDAEAIATLDLTAAVGTATVAMSPDTSDIIKIQLVSEFASGTLETETAQVKIRPTDIVES